MPTDTVTSNDVWLAAYMASTPDHVYFKDRESRFVWVSDSLACSLGRGPEEIIGRTDADFFGADRARSFRMAECDIINTGKPIVDQIVEHAWPDGHLTWSLNVAMPVRDASGHIIGIWGTNKDITQTKLTERALEIKSQELERLTQAALAASQAKTAFLAKMATSVKNNAQNLAEANQRALAARQQAGKGGSVVHNAVRAMQEINSSTKRIAEITGIIDQIAFQTNLLALNAAVEAAHAGDQGRGFAVVASEVRNLAGRSAAAAKEIKALIQDSVAKVRDGTELVDESGIMLGEIETSVKKVGDIIAEISAAGQEQAAGIAQENKALLKMDEVAQQNAALIEKAATVAGRF
jgi:PAS domain S-box-containing protein